MGQILEDMTKASRERIEKYQVNPDNVENEEGSQNLEEARERGDWLFIFEAARETHMFQGATTDRVLLFEGLPFKDEACVWRFQPLDYKI